MIAAWAMLVLTAQPTEGATTQPRARFIICPGDRRCPRGGDPAPMAGGGGARADLAPTYGTVTLNGGFVPDPRRVRLRSGGTLAAATLAPGCGGFVSPAPDMRVNYRANALPLTFTAVGRDVSLLINAPDGRWYCTPLSGARASYRFATPGSGRYEIWVGAPRGGGTDVELQISELPEAGTPPAE